MTLAAIFSLTLAVTAFVQSPTVTPSTIPASQPTTRLATPLSIVPRETWGSRPLPLPAAARHVPKLITLHHAGVTWRAGGDPVVSLRNLQRYGQKDKGWPDLPYHYLIAPDGRVYEGRDVNYRPESNTAYDLNGVLNVELMGNFQEQRVSVEQLRATVQLIAKLCDDLQLDPATIRGHNDAAPGQTDCPGRDFHRYIADGSIRKWVEQTRRGETPKVEELPELPEGPTTRISTTMPGEAAN